MNDYTFSTLNDKEFEELAKDLLNSEFKFGLRSFPAGRDKGIDLRKSSKDNKNSIIVQVKHYINSSVSSLKNSLKKELVKVDALKPDRYIIVTSLKLTANQKDMIVESFQPHIKSNEDIFAQQDLNDLVCKNEEIEKRYYKLWLSSVNILQKILNNGVESRSTYLLEQISKKIKYYVTTDKINQANKILKNEKILLITGEPGVGKTTLAEIILFNRAKWNYKIYFVEDIIEAENVISSNIEEKQIFYFDDFLGANYTEIINSHKTETRLTNFVERIYNTPNKYLILTTRTVILNYATHNYERINNSKLNVGKFELKVEDYTKFEKAKILYNHLYFKNIRGRFFEAITKDKFYFKIIEHRSYRPRIIEFITDDFKIKEFNSQQYKEFILSNLNNPEDIWSYSFHNQINYFDRCLLLTLFSYQNNSEEERLSKSFKKRLEYEKTHNNQVLENNQYHKSLKLLSNGFLVIITRNLDTRVVRLINFINPSLADFLMNYINGAYSEKLAIFSSFIFSTQLRRFNPRQRQFVLEKELQKIIRDKIYNREFLDLQENNNLIFLEIIDILVNYCNDVNVDILINDQLLKIDYDSQWTYTESSKLIDFVTLFREDKHLVTFKTIQNNFIKIISKVLLSLDSDLYASDIRDNFEKYGYDFITFRDSTDGVLKIEGFISNCVKSQEEDKFDILGSELTHIDEVIELYDSLKLITMDLLDAFEIDDSNRIYKPIFDQAYWIEKVKNNAKKNKRYLKEKSNYKFEEKKSLESRLVNEDKLIDNLFK